MMNWKESLGNLEEKTIEFILNKEINCRLALNLSLLPEITANFFLKATIEYSKIRFLLKEIS